MGRLEVLEAPFFLWWKSALTPHGILAKDPAPGRRCEIPKLTLFGEETALRFGMTGFARRQPVCDWGTKKESRLARDAKDLFLGTIATNLVADATDSANKRAIRAGINLAPQIIDINVDDIGDGFRMHSPNLLNNSGASDRSTRMAQEKFQECILLRTQVDNAPATGHAVRNTEIGRAHV